MTDTEKRLGEIAHEWQATGHIISEQDLDFLLATVRGLQEERRPFSAAWKAIADEKEVENARLRGALDGLEQVAHVKGYGRANCDYPKDVQDDTQEECPECLAREWLDELAGPEGGEAVVSIGHIHPEGETRPDCPMCPEPTDGGAAEI